MKNVFKKAVSLTVALSTVAALSVSAFAAPSATYDPDTQAVTVKDYTATGTGQYAVAVVDAGLESYTDANIYYVNQADQATIGGIIANMLVKGELTEGKDYEVRIGNNAGQLASDGVSAVEVITFTIEGDTILYGDVFSDGKVNNKDLAYLQRYRASWTGYDETTCDLAAADVAKDGKINNKDLAYLQRHRASWVGYETLPIE